MVQLALQGVCYEAGGRRVLDRVSAELVTGARSIVLGANGAGKSLLLRLCHGLLRPSAGTIHWRAASERAVRQTIVFQRPVMLRRSVLGNVMHALATSGVSHVEARQRALAALERVDLQHLTHRAARVLSGGEQQRVALARAWALEPDVLFLDEPTASLDPAAARQVEAIVQAIHENGTKVIMTTHNLAQARRLGDEVLFMAGGRLVERSPVERFFTSPATREGAEFIQGESP